MLPLRKRKHGLVEQMHEASDSGYQDHLSLSPKKHKGAHSSSSFENTHTIAVCLEPQQVIGSRLEDTTLHPTDSQATTSSNYMDTFNQNNNFDHDSSRCQDQTTERRQTPENGTEDLLIRELHKTASTSTHIETSTITSNSVHYMEATGSVTDAEEECNPDLVLVNSKEAQNGKSSLGPSHIFIQTHSEQNTHIRSGISIESCNRLHTETTSSLLTDLSSPQHSESSWNLPSSGTKNQIESDTITRIQDISPSKIVNTNASTKTVAASSAPNSPLSSENFAADPPSLRIPISAFNEHQSNDTSTDIRTPSEADETELESPIIVQNEAAPSSTDKKEKRPRGRPRKRRRKLKTDEHNASADSEQTASKMNKSSSRTSVQNPLGTDRQTKHDKSNHTGSNDESNTRITSRRELRSNTLASIASGGGKQFLHPNTASSQSHLHHQSPHHTSIFSGDVDMDGQYDIEYDQLAALVDDPLRVLPGSITPDPLFDRNCPGSTRITRILDEPNSIKFLQKLFSEHLETARATEESKQRQTLLPSQPLPCTPVASSSCSISTSSTTTHSEPLSFDLGSSHGTESNSQLAQSQASSLIDMDSKSTGSTLKVASSQHNSSMAAPNPVRRSTQSSGNTEQSSSSHHKLNSEQQQQQAYSQFFYGPNIISGASPLEQIALTHRQFIGAKILTSLVSTSNSTKFEHQVPVTLYNLIMSTIPCKKLVAEGPYAHIVEGEAALKEAFGVDLSQSNSLYKLNSIIFHFIPNSSILRGIVSYDVLNP